MIKISDSRKISRVVISTALGLDGKGIFPHTLRPRYRSLLKTAKETGTTVITKSITRHPRKGNFIPWNPFTWKYIQKLPGGGMLNAYGLTNPGIIKCVKNYNYGGSANIIPSLYPEFSKGEIIEICETIDAVEILEKIGINVVELNFSCPNSKETIGKNMERSLNCVRKLKKNTMFIIAKISVVHPHEFAQELELAGIDAIHSINTIPFELIYPYPGKVSPLAKVGGGGVSGDPIFYDALKYNIVLRKKIKIPMIMGGGITNPTRAQYCFDNGANTVSICTINLIDPRVAQKIIESFNV